MAADHTPACVEARFGGKRLFRFYDGRINAFPDMGELTPAQREVVLACPHWAHDNARFIWRVR